MTSPITIFDSNGIVVRRGTQSPGGGSQPNALTLLGPFTLDFDTAGFLNPIDNGVEVIPIPAGTFVAHAYAIVTSEFDGAQPGDELNVVLLDGAGAGHSLSEYAATELGPGAIVAGVAAYEVQLLGASAALDHKAGVAITDCFIVAGLFMSDPVTQGSVDIYAIVATPTP